jgi:hypothetical protein
MADGLEGRSKCEFRAAAIVQIARLLLASLAVLLLIAR